MGRLPYAIILLKRLFLINQMIILPLIDIDDMESKVCLKALNMKPNKDNEDLIGKERRKCEANKNLPLQHYKEILILILR